MAAGDGQNSSVDSYKADNPWALPPLQQVPSFPRYFDSQKDTSIPDAPATGGYSQPSAPGSAGQSGAAPQSYTPYGNGAANSESKPRYWFQQQPRFVTPEILDSIKEQQMRMQKTPTPWQQYSAPRNPRGTDARPLYRRYPAWSSSLSMPTTPDALRDETLLYRGDVLSSIPDAAL
ncbi:MAG TPA: hypothetical protein ENJ64_04650, partial [Thiotrichales bacterium]|nr:hypothetical protein [Thiotrichales bacterium]